MKTLETIGKRCSCRAFKGTQLSQKEVEIVLAAGNAAPVGMGKFDSLKFTVIQSPKLLKKIDLEGGKFFNEPERHPLYGAPTLIMISATAGDAHEREMSMCNASCIIENMMIAATDIGLGSCYIMGNTMAIRDNKEICDEIKVPEGFMLCAGVVIGYPIQEPISREPVINKIAVEYVK